MVRKARQAEGLVSFFLLLVVDESPSFSSTRSLVLCRPPILTRVTGPPCCLAPATIPSNVRPVRGSLPKADASPSVASSGPHPAFLPLHFYSRLLFHLCRSTHQPPPHRHKPTQLFLPLATCCFSVVAPCCAKFYSTRVFLLPCLSKLLTLWNVYV